MSARERGYDYRWEQARIIFLEKNKRICAECKRQGYDTEATVVDHIIPHRGDQKLFWDEANWQCLCKTCHAIKTSRGE